MSVIMFTLTIELIWNIRTFYVENILKQIFPKTPSKAPSKGIFERTFKVDRVPKKSKISERPAEFTVHSRDNSKNFLLKEF